MSYLTLHYIDIQGKKYYQKFNEILRAIGEHPVEQKKPSVPIQEKPISVILEEKVASVPRAEPSPIAAPQKFRIGGVTILIGGIIAIAICIGVILISNLHFLSLGNIPQPRLVIPRGSYTLFCGY